MGGQQIPGHGTGDDGWDEEGYDESQRAEILEATRDGPTDGIVLTDLAPDLGDEDEGESIDERRMTDDEVGESDATVTMSDEDIEEDDVQEELDDGSIDEDEDLDDAADVALKP